MRWILALCVALLSAKSALAGDYNLQLNWQNLQARSVAIEFIQAAIVGDEVKFSSLITQESTISLYDEAGNNISKAMNLADIREFFNKCLVRSVDVQNTRDVLVSADCTGDLGEQYMRIEVTDNRVSSAEPFSVPSISTLNKPRED